jgi:reactive intermediate/imine deaminase
MPKQHFAPPVTMPDGRPLPLSVAVRAGNFVYLSGMIPASLDGVMVEGDITVQTHVVMRLLGEHLALAGCGFEDVVKVTAWLTNLEDFPGFNEAYRTYFKAHFPARSAVRCDLLRPGARLEVECVAYKPAT